LPTFVEILLTFFDKDQILAGGTSYRAYDFGAALHSRGQKAKPDSFSRVQNGKQFDREGLRWTVG
jgi:hypothetical protein